MKQDVVKGNGDGIAQQRTQGIKIRERVLHHADQVDIRKPGVADRPQIIDTQQAGDGAGRAVRNTN